MKKYGITLFLTLILQLGLVVPAVSAQMPDAAPAETQEQSPELLDATVVAKGIDVSHHQGAINWDAVAGQIDFAVIRCGYGGNLSSQDDRQWSANVAACERLGIPYGVYLYSYAATDDEASDEAQHVLRLLQGHTPQLPVYLDLEDSVISSNCSAADILRHTTIFCNAIQAAGYRAGVYAIRNWWTTLLTDAAYDQWERWIAVWADQTNYNKPYQMWQYSSKGQISGISGNVDLDYWYGAPLTGTHRHTYQVTAQTAATCTQPGQTTYTCACGATKTETTARWAITTAPGRHILRPHAQWRVWSALSAPDARLIRSARSRQRACTNGTPVCSCRRRPAPRTDADAIPAPSAARRRTRLCPPPDIPMKKGSAPSAASGTQSCFWAI